MKSSDDLEWLHFVREHELQKAFPYFPNERQLAVLEIGSGTGYMLGRIRRRFPNAVGLEVRGSAYSAEDPTIAIYDGNRIPYPDESFDVVFSSHVLEHIADIPSFLSEMKRVLRLDGMCIHIMPSPTWRLLTSLMHYPALITIAAGVGKRRQQPLMERASRKKKSDLFKFMLYAPRHGETGNILTEAYHFRRRRWIEAFSRAGFGIAVVRGTDIVYWGRDTFRRWLPLEYRSRLAAMIGSSSIIYVARR